VISGSPSWQRVCAHFTRDINPAISDPVIGLRNRRVGSGAATRFAHRRAAES